MNIELPRKPTTQSSFKSFWLLLLIAVVLLTTIVLSRNTTSANTMLPTIPIQLGPYPQDSPAAVPAAAPAKQGEEIDSLKRDIALLRSEMKSVNKKLFDVDADESDKSEIQRLRRQLHALQQKAITSDKISPPAPRNLILAKPTQQPSAERLSPFVNKYYVQRGGDEEWAFDRLERRYKTILANESYPKLSDNTSSNDILFVDGREQCETARGFLTAVRQSGFVGKIVFMVYYQEDESDCQPLADSFQPMIIFYRDTPIYEPTLTQFHGIVNYGRAFYEDISNIKKVIVVKPEDVYWCNQRNPFDDVPSDSNSFVYSVYGRKTDIDAYELKIRAPSDDASCYNPQGIWNKTEEDIARRENAPISSFVAASNFMALMQFARVTIDYWQVHDLDDARAAHDMFKGFHERSDTISMFLRSNFKVMLPEDRYNVANCHKYLPETASCHDCNHATVMVGTSSCVRRVTYKVPNYTPFCHQPYREAIMEVPYKTSMAAYANKHILAGAHIIRDQPKKIFAEPPDTNRSVCEVCPHGQMAVVSMMAGYDITTVDKFVGSFLANANPNCVKLVMIIKPGLGMERVSEYFPSRVEYVLLNESSEFYPVKMRGCKPADSRFEVAQRWLEKNFHRFKYVIAPDARDYIWQADPLAQLVNILERQGYLDDEFAGSVAETFTFAGQTHPSWVVGSLLRNWIGSCGRRCVRKMAKLRYTNGEPLAILNSGHIIGTSLGLLHYFRFHVRMMNESGHRCDGTDQGLFTYYVYGMLQEAHFPHKVLIFSSSRSGFANMPSPSRMTKRLRTDDPKPKEEMELLYSMEGLPMEDRYDNNTVKDEIFDSEYSISDCNNNIIAGLHQYDRHGNNYFFLERSPFSWKAWVPWKQNKTFYTVFGKPSS